MKDETMTILSQQYESLLDSKHRLDFRNELLALYNKNPQNLLPLKTVLQAQSVGSLVKLLDTMNFILFEAHSSRRQLPITMKQFLETIIQEVENIIAKLPIDLDVLNSGFNANSFRAWNSEDKPYIVINFDMVLEPIIKKLLDSSQYSNFKMLLWANSPDQKYIKKTSIREHEHEIVAQLYAEINLAKSEIFNTLKERLERQKTKCSFNQARIDDSRLQIDLRTAEQQIQKLDQLALNSETTPQQIIKEIEVTHTICHQIDDSIESFKAQQNFTEQQSIFHRKLNALAVEEKVSPVPKNTKTQWARFEIPNLIEITPRSQDAFANLYIFSKSKYAAQIIRETCRPYISTDLKTLLFAQRGDIMFVDLEKLTRKGNVIEEVKAKLFENQGPIIEELKALVEFSKQRCCSDEQRQNSPELTLIKDKGESLLGTFSEINSPEKLIQAIIKTNSYYDKVASAIETFKQMNNSTGMRK